MSRTGTVPLEVGQVYRTGHLRRWGANPTRLAERLEREGALRRLTHGLYYAPRHSKFGEVPPAMEVLLDVFLQGTSYVLTGPARWNALGLGSTALFAHPLVYNMKRSGRLSLGARTFDFRQRAFPVDPSAEWFVIDLLRHTQEAGVSRSLIEENLTRALSKGRFDADRLVLMAERFGRRQEQDTVQHALGASQ